MLQSAPPRFPSGPARACAALLAVLVLAAMLGGCSTLGFYHQAIAGQLDIWRRERPIERVLADESVPAHTRERLALTVRARAFAADTLGLPSEGSYRTYADLERPYVVWNVFAAPTLALEPVQSCFPFAGCLDYRGYFARADAERHAATLRAVGNDVYLGGVAAYSTLGWFDDPVLNTFLGWDEADLVELLFHELAHQRLYIADDSAFNESYASAVAAAGLDQWFVQQGQATARVRTVRAARRAMTERILAARAALAAIYAGTMPDERKLAAKQAALAALAADLAGLAAQHGLPEAPAQPWNNARVLAVATYHDHVAAFHTLLALVDGDWTRFHAAAARIGALAAAARTRCLLDLAATEALPPCAG